MEKAEVEKTEVGKAAVRSDEVCLQTYDMKPLQSRLGVSSWRERKDRKWRNPEECLELIRPEEKTSEEERKRRREQRARKVKKSWMEGEEDILLLFQR